MSRVSHILSLSLPDGVMDSVGLCNAYISCLSPLHACDLLRNCAAARADLRESTLRKVCVDIDESFAECHRQLLQGLLVSFSETDSRGRQSLGYCLATIAAHVPARDRRAIQEFFLDSKYVGARRRGYKSVSAETDLPLGSMQKAWERFGDPECAWAIVKAFPTAFLVQHRAALAKSFSEGWQFARLYRRIAATNPNLVTELRDIDEISYCYVLAKLGMKLARKEAREIVDNNLGSERLGLLVWSLGRLHMWGVLLYVESQLPAIEERALADIRIKYGI